MQKYSWVCNLWGTELLIDHHECKQDPTRWMFKMNNLVKSETLQSEQAKVSSGSVSVIRCEQIFPKTNSLT